MGAVRSTPRNTLGCHVLVHIAPQVPHACVGIVLCSVETLAADLARCCIASRIAKKPLPGCALEHKVQDLLWLLRKQLAAGTALCKGAARKGPVHAAGETGPPSGRPVRDEPASAAIIALKRSSW